MDERWSGSPRIAYYWLMLVPGGDATRPAPARRMSTSRWRDPRLLLGVLLVLGSAALGGWLFSTTRDSTDYWMVRDDVRVGDRVSSADLAPAKGRVDAAAAGSLVPVAEGTPAGVWTHDVAAGTLLTRDAVAAEGRRGRQLPLLVAVGSLPADLRVGERVDVWSGPGPDGVPTEDARRLLSGAAVMAVTRSDGTGSRTVVVDTGPEGPTPTVVGQAASGHLTVVRVP